MCFDSVVRFQFKQNWNLTMKWIVCMIWRNDEDLAIGLGAKKNNNTKYNLRSHMSRSNKKSTAQKMWDFFFKKMELWRILFSLFFVYRLWSKNNVQRFWIIFPMKLLNVKCPEQSMCVDVLFAAFCVFWRLICYYVVCVHRLPIRFSVNKTKCIIIFIICENLCFIEFHK